MAGEASSEDSVGTEISTRSSDRPLGGEDRLMDRIHLSGYSSHTLEEWTRLQTDRDNFKGQLDSIIKANVELRVELHELQAENTKLKFMLGNTFGRDTRD